MSVQKDRPRIQGGQRRIRASWRFSLFGGNRVHFVGGGGRRGSRIQKGRGFVHSEGGGGVRTGISGADPSCCRVLGKSTSKQKLQTAVGGVPITQKNHPGGGGVDFLSRRVINLLKGLDQSLRKRIRLNLQFRQDLAWWLALAD